MPRRRLINDQLYQNMGIDPFLADLPPFPRSEPPVRAEPLALADQLPSRSNADIALPSLAAHVGYSSPPRPQFDHNEQRNQAVSDRLQLR